MGIILSGSALVKRYDKVYGFMGLGELIGYMNWMKLPGCDEHAFNILAEKEGYIAVLPYRSLKVMYKRDPALVKFQLNEKF